MRICQNPSCNKPIPADKRADAKYCSKRCKNDAFMLNRAQQLGGPAIMPAAPAISGATAVGDTATQFIISQLERERDKLEEKLRDEENKRHEAERLAEEYKSKLTELEKEWEIERVKQEKPNGLSGFLESFPPDTRAQLLAAAPAIIQSIFRAGGGAGQQHQLSGQPLSEALQNIVKWMSSLPRQQQEAIYNSIMVPLAELRQSDGEAAMMEALKYFDQELNNIAHGT